MRLVAVYRTFACSSEHTLKAAEFLIVDDFTVPFSHNAVTHPNHLKYFKHCGHYVTGIEVSTAKVFLISGL